MDLQFEWDSAKATSNLQIHGIDFEDAARVFYDPERIERFDARANYSEDRFLTVGVVGSVELAVVYTMRGEVIRIISARKAESYERIEYWKNR